MRGRVGSTVLRKGQRAVIASQYQPQVANPRSYAQAVQRCAFATTTAAQKALYDIVDHSFEGLSSRRENLQEFVRVNSKKIAALIKSAPNNTANVVNLKGVPGIQLAPFQISRGSLSAPYGWSPSILSAGEKKGSWANDAVGSAGSYALKLRDFFNCSPGDQLTFVALVAYVGQTIGSYASSSGAVARNVFVEVLKGRITFAASPSSFEQPLFNVANGTISSDYVESVEGDIVLKGQVSQNDGHVRDFSLVVARDIDDGSVMIVGASAIIRSQLSERGYLYSTASLVVNEGAIDEIGGDYLSTFVESYQTSTASFASDYYLDNAV